MPGTGWKVESYDSRDKPYRSPLQGRMERRVILPEVNAKLLEPIYDQVSTGSCVANATAAAYRFCARKWNEKGDPKAKLMDDPSRLFIYFNARYIPVVQTSKVGDTIDRKIPEESIDPEGGSENRDSFKGMNIFGVCPELSWPWKVPENRNAPDHLNEPPKQEAYDIAKQACAIEYCRLDPDHPTQVEKDMNEDERKAVGIVTLMQLKQCLTEGYPVVFGFWYYWNNLPLEQKNGEWVLPELPPNLQHNPNAAHHGGHTVLCVGYDNDKKAVLCQNSWGANPKTGGAPRFWMPYNWITDWECTDDFWMVRAIGKRDN